MNLDKAGRALKDQDIDFLYVSSFDENISEYVPKEDSLRYTLSQFSGSVAVAVLHQDGKLTLFVDGRYHEQADIECSQDNILIEKVPYGVSLQSALVSWLETSNVKKIGYVATRTPEVLRANLARKCETVAIDHEKFFHEIEFNPKSFSGVVSLTSEGFEPTHSKCSRLIKDNEAYFISGLDTLSWMTNLRSYSIPFQSSFRGVALATSLGVHVFTDCTLDKESKLRAEVTLHSFDKWKEVCESLTFVKTVYWDTTFTNAHYVSLLKNDFSRVEVKPLETPFAYSWHALKSEEEITSFKKAFNNSDTAIYNAFKWFETKVNSDEKISEAEFKEMVTCFYKDEGARGHSFSSISGFGANSSIIHYSNASSGVFYEKGQNVLLDSGAYYEGGLATDCTRTMCFGAEPSRKQKEIYTLVLKSLLGLLNLSFKKGTVGREIDEVARKPIVEAGYNYSHGTGHGIGVNVHEHGYSVTPMSDMEIREGTVGSLEPGIYIEGFGGVRLENVVVVVKDPDKDGHLRFDNMIFIGFCHTLIDESMLTELEKSWLDNYEESCKAKGRSFI